jgi:hypothetical protein
MKTKLACILCCLSLAFAGVLTAQNDDTGTRSVQGVVTDASGSPVAGAVVQLKDTKSLQIRSYRTEADGNYHFAGLSTNVEYELEAKNDSAASGKKTLTVFDTHKAATVNLKLKK